MWQDEKLWLLETVRRLRGSESIIDCEYNVYYFTLNFAKEEVLTNAIIPCLAIEGGETLPLEVFIEKLNAFTPTR